MPRTRAAAAQKLNHLTDEEFAALGRSYRAAATNVLQAKAMKDEYQERILAELEARKQVSVSIDDILITRKRKRTRTFDVAALRKKLGTRASTVIEEKVRTAEVDALVKAGVLPTQTIEVDGEAVNVIAGIETVDWSAPYIDVTFRKA